VDGQGPAHPGAGPIQVGQPGGGAAVGREELFRACVTAGGDPEACAERARAAFAACLEGACTPEPTCEDRCRARAEEFFRRCVEAGHSREACAERARSALEACLHEQCELCLCPEVFDPVCGADGKTYPNACVARCAGVEVVHPGECSMPCRCNGDCPTGDVCRDGGCQPPCEIRCLTPDPVCGSDGRTYACGLEDAACHGVTVLHRGECRPVCEQDADCQVGSICQPVLSCSDPCGCASFCVPCACPRILDPVCGADGRTYPNACEARCAHVAIVHKGSCQRTSSYRLLLY
jgi:hypothetical protein